MVIDIINKKFNLLKLPFQILFKGLWIGLSAWLLSFLLYSPRFILFLGKNSGITRRDELLKQCIDPFVRGNIDVQLYTRIVQPSIANFLGWCGERRDFFALLGSPGIAYLALILTLTFLYFSLRRYFSNSLSIVGTFAVSTSMVTQWTNTHWGHPDSLTLLPISILMFRRNYYLIIFCTIVGFLNDERFILSIPFLLLWWSLTREKKSEKFNFLGLILSFIIGLTIITIFKFALVNGYIGPGIDDYNELNKHLIGNFLSKLNPIRWPNLLFRIFLGFRWLWILPILGLLQCIRFKRKDIFLIFSISIVLASIACFNNADISRSISFIYPFIPVSMIIMKDIGKWSNHKLINFLSIILLLNIFTPAASVYNFPPNLWKTNPFEWAHFAFPLPINIWRWITSPNGAATW